MCIQQPVSNSSQPAASPEKPVTVPRSPVVMPKLQKKSLKPDVTPAPQIEVYIKPEERSVQHFDFGIPVKHIQQAVSNSSQPLASPEKPVTVPRSPIMMPKLQKKSLKPDVTPAPQIQVYIKPEERPVHHFDFGIPVKYIQQAVSSSSQPRPPVVMPKLKMPPQVNQLKAAAGPRPQPVSASEPQASTPSVAGTCDLRRGKITGKKGAESAQLETQKAVLLQEKEKFKALLVQIEMGKALLCKVVQEKEQINTAGSLKIEQLEAAAKHEKEQKIQTERLLAEQLAETKRLKEELAQAQKKLEEEKLQREEDVSRLQAEHIKMRSMMEAAATKAQEDLENERSQWLQERSTIQAALKSLKESIDETMEEKEKFITDVMNQVHQLEQTQEEAQKKPKKRSLRKRFMQLFKRS